MRERSVLPHVSCALCRLCSVWPYCDGRVSGSPASRRSTSKAHNPQRSVPRGSSRLRVYGHGMRLEETLMIDGQDRPAPTARAAPEVLLLGRCPPSNSVAIVLANLCYRVVSCGYSSSRSVRSAMRAPGERGLARRGSSSKADLPQLPATRPPRSFWRERRSTYNVDDECVSW